MDSPIYEEFLTAKSVVNQEARQHLMILIDFGKSINMWESEELYRHLMEFCSVFAAEADLKDKSDQEKIGLAELAWTERLLMVIKNLQKAKDCSERLKHLLAIFNSTHDYQVTVF